MRFTSVLNDLKCIIFTHKTGPILQPENRAFGEARIHRHYEIMDLESRGVEEAVVRPTDWHGEGGTSGDNQTGHLTVDFRDKDGNHVTTHHVYKDDSHYPS
ncbi:hypothetical protein K474DRAFT_1710720 [Panus rudis PR-1116 ss-1]|nr:hypothetical protein K474DRAFT_1710720 [Panus rudis PR-1116 ss-1]